MYALVINGQIRSGVGGLPASARRLDTGQWVLPSDGRWSDDLAAACGYLPVVAPPRPADTDTTTYESSLNLVDGQPTVVWAARDKTPAEQTDRRREDRYAALLSRVEAAQQDNRDSRVTLAQIAGATSFTNTQRDNALRYLAGRADALTVQNNALMQLVLRHAGRFDALDVQD